MVDDITLNDPTIEMGQSSYTEKKNDFSDLAKSYSNIREIAKTFVFAMTDEGFGRDEIFLVAKIVFTQLYEEAVRKTDPVIVAPLSQNYTDFALCTIEENFADWRREKQSSPEKSDKPIIDINAGANILSTGGLDSLYTALSEDGLERRPRNEYEDIIEANMGKALEEAVRDEEIQKLKDAILFEKVDDENDKNVPF